MATRRVRGGTLVEILIAVTFLSVCAAAILQTVTTAGQQGTYALHRSLVISALQDQIERARGLAATHSLGATSTTTVSRIAGLPQDVSVTTTVTQHPKSVVLWDITVTASWAEETSGRAWTDTATISSLIRQQ